MSDKLIYDDKEVMQGGGGLMYVVATVVPASQPASTEEVSIYLVCLC